ncbi:MAG: undecaprenyl-diphosphatase [Ramlibacter sp.]|nr:undecaprenyl-diphosphatase [Ramlibacter sp.]
MDVVLLVKAAVMGVVEGLTEFLPISSTGHLILAGALLGFDDERAKVFDIAIQTGAILAVIIVYWKKIRDTLVALPTQRQAQRFALNVVIGVLPAIMLGLIFGKAIKENLFTAAVVATTFILGGFVILWAEKRTQVAARIHDVDEMTPWDALKVGLVQCLAQPVQGAGAAVDGRLADVPRWPAVLVHQRMDLRALAVALHLHPQLHAVRLVSHRFRHRGIGYRVDRHDPLG